MNIEKETNGFKDFSFTEKIRIFNVIVYGLLIFFANIYQHFALILLLFYIHLFVISLFLILELQYVILTKKNFFNHICTNLLVLIGFIILTFDLTKMFLKIDFVKIILGKI